MLNQIAQIKNLLESVVAEGEVIADKHHKTLIEMDELKKQLDFENGERLAIRKHCDFLRKELDMMDKRDLEQRKRIKALRESQVTSEERELAMLSQLIDIQVVLDRLREKFVVRQRETDYCGEHNSIFERCDYCRGKLQAWNTAISMLDEVVQGTFWGDVNNG